MHHLFQKTIGGSVGYDALLESTDNKTMSDWSLP